MGALNKQTVRVCGRCQTRYLADSSQTDFVHDCGGADSEALRTEDVINLGDFTDFQDTGQEVTGGRGSAQEVFLQGVGNHFFGTRAAIEGESFHGVTARGSSRHTHRTRRHFAYKILNGGGK